MRPLQTTLEHPADGVLLLSVGDELDRESAPAFEEELLRALASAEEVVVDLSSCPFLDSSALSVLARAQEELDTQRLAIVLPATHLARTVFRLTRLDELLDLHLDRDSALGRD